MIKYLRKLNVINLLYFKSRNLLFQLMPKTSSELIYFKKFKKKLNLKCPKTFNEKLQWLKLNNMNELNIMCTDKYKVRKYIKEKKLEKLLCQLYGVYNNADEIDFEKLPNKFVLKGTHGCGYNIICSDKEKLDIKNTKRVLNKWLKEKYGNKLVEPHYNQIKPKIICEEYLEDSTYENLVDYKIYCFNGKPYYTLVCLDRENDIKKVFYDLKWNKISFRKDNASLNIEQPACYKEMLEYAQTLSEPFPFVRVDFYSVNNKPIIGELTFTPGACLSNEYTDKAEKFLGDLIHLPKKI